MIINYTANMVFWNHSN